MKTKQHPAVLAFLTVFSTAFSAGCVSSAVNPEARDTSGAFAGKWDGMVELTKETQLHNKVMYTCRKFHHPFALDVEDGYVSGSVGRGLTFKTPIDPSGRFYAVVDSDLTFREEGGVAGRSGTIDFLIEGNLNAQSNAGGGTLTIASSDGVGCDADFSVTRKT